MALAPITGGGAFTRSNIDAINSNFAAIDRPDLWVRPQYGNNTTANGTYERPFASVGGAIASPLLKPGMSIGLLGVTQEEVSAPVISDITIVGMANQPRQATTSGVPNGGGATWLSPTGGTGVLLKPNGQGWKIQNIYFNNSAAQPCIQLVSLGDPPALADAGHTQILGCRFTGADCGIQILGGPGFNTIQGCTFLGFSGSGDCGIETSTGIGGTGWGTKILNCDFQANTIHIDVALLNVEIAYCHFTYTSASVTTTTQLDLTGCTDASVHHNTFDVPFNQNGLSAMFVAGTNDRYVANALGTACLTPMTGVVWGKPVSGAA